MGTTSGISQRMGQGSTKVEKGGEGTTMGTTAQGMGRGAHAGNYMQTRGEPGGKDEMEPGLFELGRHM